MKRTPKPPRSEDPIAIAQRILDNEPAPFGTAPPRRDKHLRVAAPAARTASSFPACPDGTSAQVWRLTEHWLALASDSGRYRLVSPWHFATMLQQAIWNDPAIRQMIRKHGDDVVEDLVRRMVEIFWRDVVESGDRRSRILNLFLEDYWTPLWDAALTQVRTDRIKAQIAAGTLRVAPKVVRGSLLNDTDYQAELAEIRTGEFLRKNPPDDADGQPGRSPAQTKQMLGQLLERLRSDKAKRLAEVDSKDYGESVQEVGDPDGGRKDRPPI